MKMAPVKLIKQTVVEAIQQNKKVDSPPIFYCIFLKIGIDKIHSKFLFCISLLN